MLHGFDVSAYQGTDIPTCDFVFVKATEGTGYTSSKFGAQWASAGRHARVRGAYHFARPEQGSAAHQADRLIAVAAPRPGEMLCLDLEASRLGQSATNAWAREFGDRLRQRCPGVTTVLYAGSGYATSGTGRGLSAHFDWWWYPQYPSTARTHTWRASFSPWLPGGITTGWKRPHIWQFTDNFGGLDASVSWLTLDQLAGGSHTNGGDDPLIGLKKGDHGQPVVALQLLITYAGHGAALGHAGVDGKYGDGTAEGLRLARKDAGSNAGKGFGDAVDGWAYAELLAAVSRHQAKSA